MGLMGLVCMITFCFSTRWMNMIWKEWILRQEQQLFTTNQTTNKKKEREKRKEQKISRKVYWSKTCTQSALRSEYRSVVLYCTPYFYFFILILFQLKKYKKKIIDWLIFWLVGHDSSISKKKKQCKQEIFLVRSNFFGINI